MTNFNKPSTPATKCIIRAMYTLKLFQLSFFVGFSYVLICQKVVPNDVDKMSMTPPH